MTPPAKWEAVMQAEDLAGLPVAETRELAEVGQCHKCGSYPRNTWVTMRELAEHSGWGYNTIKRLSSRNLIPGKVRHEGKVRFHLPTFDAWLLNQHHQGLVALTQGEH